MKKQHILLLIGFVIVALLAFAFVPPPTRTVGPGPAASSGKLNGNPTDFSHVGQLQFEKGSVLMLAYQESEAGPALAPLTFDAMSACVAGGSSVPCLGLDVSQDLPFQGMLAVVEGVRQDNGILVRKLMLVNPNDPGIVPGTGHVFITWPQAIEFITSCSPSLITQTHMLDVFLEFADGSRLRTVEPTIDAVMQVAQEAQATCGPIPLATE